jgi:hypothetical protein
MVRSTGLEPVWLLSELPERILAVSVVLQFHHDRICIVADIVCKLKDDVW